MKTELFLVIPIPPPIPPPVLPQYCLSTGPSTASVAFSVLSQYCLSTVPVLPQYCPSSPLSTVSVLSQYCPSTVPSPIPLEPPLGFSGEREKRGSVTFSLKAYVS